MCKNCYLDVVREYTRKLCSHILAVLCYNQYDFGLLTGAINLRIICAVIQIQ